MKVLSSFVLAAAATLSFSVHAQNVDYLHTPSYSTGPVLAKKGVPSGWNAYDTSAVFSSVGTYDMADMMVTSVPTGQYQVNTGYGWGSTAVGWYQDVKSAWIHSWTFPLDNFSPYDSIAFGNDIQGWANKRPWGQSTTAKVCISNSNQISDAYVVGAGVVQTYSGTFLHDLSTGGFINLVTLTWDSRSNLPLDEYLSNDAGQIGAFAGSYIGDNTRYTTKEWWGIGTRLGTGDFPDAYQAYCITRDNLVNLVNDFNARNSRNLSNNPDNWSISGVTMQIELANIRQPGNDGHAGVTFRDDWVTVQY